MDPYVASWTISSHNEVACVDCHYEPGVWNHLKGKYRDGQVSLVYFITGKTPGKYHAEISDAACLQTGCHDLEQLPDDVAFETIRFSHSQHLLELRRGKKLRCTTCHGQIVQGDHLKVDPNDCFICHFKTEVEDGVSKPSPISKCTLCHREIPEEIPFDDHTFFHGRYVRHDIECTSCHKGVVEGEGEVVPGNCVECHNDPDMTEHRFTSEILHANHVADHKVECFRCHAPIEHRIKPTPTISDFDESCTRCHQDRQHLGARDLYQGTGGIGVPDRPSPMYRANVDCVSCHEQFSESDGALYVQGPPAAPASVGGYSCSHCHGDGYEKMVDQWRVTIEAAVKVTSGRINQAETELLRAEGDKKISGSVVAQARATLNKARHNYVFVLNAQGHHNIQYALALLQKAADWSSEAQAAVTPGYAPEPVQLTEYGCTSLCHVGQETKAVPFRGELQFPHAPHVVENGLECSDCHGEGRDHGRVISQACDDCHHGSGEGEVTCHDCHDSVSEIFLAKGDELVPAMPSVKADKMDCTNCHTEVADGESTTLAGIQASCRNCHDEDSEKYEKMVVEWTREAETFLGDLERERDLVREAIEKAELVKKNVILARNQLTHAEQHMAILGKRNSLHNIEYARALVGATRSHLQQALKELEN
jgi:formate-dependent nitrite reductase cytochrome c552 subunit